MGFRLAGAKLGLAQPRELLSEATSAGTIQVPPDGNPIVLMADHPTTGGYPKIANVVAADLDVLAQVKPGDEIRFSEISIEKAHSLYRRREAEIARLACALRLKGIAPCGPST
jgi:antagonist of KipI